MALHSEFDSEIIYIKAKENRVVDALSITMKVIHLETISTYESDIKERVKSAQKTYEFFKTVKA
jgi:hypothetical protein